MTRHAFLRVCILICEVHIVVLAHVAHETVLAGQLHPAHGASQSLRRPVVDRPVPTHVATLGESSTTNVAVKQVILVSFRTSRSQHEL